MDVSGLGKSVDLKVKRLLRCADQVIQASAPGASQTEKPNEGSPFEALQVNLVDLEKDWSRLRDLMTATTDNAKKAACARAWLDVHVTKQVFRTVKLLLGVQHDQAVLAGVTSGNAGARDMARYRAVAVGGAAFLLLHHACCMTDDLMATGSSASDLRVGTSVLDTVFERSFVAAVADATRAVVATAAATRSETAELKRTGLPYDMAASAGQHQLAGSAALAVCKYTHLLAESLFMPLRKGTPGGPPPALSPALVQRFDVVIDTQLLAAAAASLVDSPPVYEDPDVLEATRNHVCCAMQGASVDAARAMFIFTRMMLRLPEGGRKNGEGLRLAEGLLRVARHEAVVRLQVGLLDQLAAHAGMGAELEGQQVAQAQGQQGEQQAGGGGGWAGVSGAWWFANEEARQGQLLGLGTDGGSDGASRGGEQTRSNTAGWLEDYHCHVMHVTLVDWVATGPAAALYKLAGPPPLQFAQLAARASEAVCRLCRGQGLGGAYAPAPEWQCAMAQVLHMLQARVAAGLPAATAQACMPHWLEATGWAVAMLADATAAMLGRLPVQERPPIPRRSLDHLAVEKGSQAETLVKDLQLLRDLALNESYGLHSLSAAAKDDTRRRMFHCGLAASLDHTLRLLYTAQDSTNIAVASMLEPVTELAAMLLQLGFAPMLPPTAGRGSGDRYGGHAAAGGSSSSSGCAHGAGEGSPQLGLLLTLSKRAAMLARALEAGAATAGGGGGQDQGGGLPREQVAMMATELFALLGAAVGSVEGCVRDGVAAARQRLAGAAGGEGGGDEDNHPAWMMDAVCMDEAHEMVALAARAASNLAAPLAWQLAAELAAAATAARAPLRSPHLQEGATWAVSELLARAVGWWRQPLLLPPAQLLACQPHRLLAAACALAAALPDTMNDLKRTLYLPASYLLVVMSSHRSHTGRVRSWLAPPPAAAASAGGRDEALELDACAGCLRVPVQRAVQHMQRVVPQAAAVVGQLLKAAEGEADPSGQGSPGVAFQRCAARLADMFQAVPDDIVAAVIEDRLLPDSLGAALAPRVHGASLPLTLRPQAPSGVLPPPLALRPSRGGALPRLNMCGNPRCGNFGAEREGALPLKQCRGCGAVRYCGVDCQRAHWREGHKAECKLLATEAG